jgi:hypothetical protein
MVVRINPDTLEQNARVQAGLPTIGANYGTVTNTSRNVPKPWEKMTPAEQQAALAKVDWGGLGQIMDTTDPGWRDRQPGAGAGTPANTPAVPVTPAPAPVANTQAFSDLFADAAKVLQEQYGMSQENINAAIARMRSDPYNTANAYAGMQLAPARVAADPLAQYMMSTGLSDQQSAAAAQLAQAEADAYGQAMRNVQSVLQQSQEQANASRLADIGLIETGAQQDLEQNLNMLRLGLEQQRIGGLTNLQQQNLQNSLEVRNAIANQISNIFSGQNVAPESILKLIEAALSKINTNQWTNFPGMGA